MTGATWRASRRQPDVSDIDFDGKTPPMDLNPYKAPQERGTRGASFPWQRVGNVAAIVVISVYLMLILAIILLVVVAPMLPPIWLD